ncbi:substrate-binding domain-containing protein [Streptomyces humicola]|uniref:substrate-binding domain-containing protein n=1 Tax=Streptomyces humicola TaxID=2953240 RepID=UPI003556ABEA
MEHALLSPEDGQAAATRLLQCGITASELPTSLALGAVRAARRRGLDVPKDLSVVGYDDSSFMTCIDPALTMIRRPIESMGRAAIELLVSELAGAKVMHDELLFEPELVVRASTGPARGCQVRPFDRSASGAAEGRTPLGAALCDQKLLHLDSEFVACRFSSTSCVVAWPLLK